MKAFIERPTNKEINNIKNNKVGQNNIQQHGFCVLEICGFFVSSILRVENPCFQGNTIINNKQRTKNETARNKKTS